MPPSVPSDAAQATAASTTPAPEHGGAKTRARGGKVTSISPPFLANKLNNFLHLPYVYDISWYVVWAIYIVASPLLNLLGLGCMLAHDLFTGKFWTERYVDAEDRAILITGCDSGFGYDAAVELALNRGFRVYAGCLTEAGMAQLAALAKAAAFEGANGNGRKRGQGRVGKLIPLQLDVTNRQHMDAAFERVERECGGRLFAVVNNAGVGLGGMVDWMPEEHFRFVMDVNFHAVIAACKRAIPLLQRQVLFERDHARSPRQALHPRIVNVTSFAGLYYGQCAMGAYSASKHACEAFSSSLRAELGLCGIDVCVLNPTFHATGMVADAVDVTEKAFRDMPPAKQALYGHDFVDELRRMTALTAQTTPWDPKNVCRALAHAATAQRPRRQYILGMDGRFVLTPLLMVPEPLADAIAYAGTGRHRLRPVWFQGSAQAAASEGDETSIRVIKEVSDETKDSTVQGASD